MRESQVVEGVAFVETSTGRGLRFPDEFQFGV
jgi:hypothetical protein